MGTDTHRGAMWRSEDILDQAVFSFHHVCSRGCPQVVRLDRCLYLPSNSTDPVELSKGGFPVVPGAALGTESRPLCLLSSYCTAELHSYQLALLDVDTNTDFIIIEYY